MHDISMASEAEAPHDTEAAASRLARGAIACVELFLPRRRPPDQNDRTLVLVLLMLGFVQLLIAALVLVMPLSAGAARFGLVNYAVYEVYLLAVLCAFRWSEAPVLCAHAFLLSFLAQIVVISLLRQGIQTPAVLMLIAAPVIACILQGLYWGMGWAVVVLLTWVLLFNAEQLGISVRGLSFGDDAPVAIAVVFTNTLLACIAAIGTYVVINTRWRMRLARSADEMAALAGQDPLTGALNRRSFNGAFSRTLKRCTRLQGQFVLLLGDLNDFKQINDSLGHQAGDRVLMEFAQRLRKSVRSTDCVARLGGDEFAVVLDTPTTAQGLASVMQTIQQQLAHSVPYRQQKIPLCCSFGAAVYPEHGQTAEALFEAADRALYTAKSGRELWRLAG